MPEFEIEVNAQYQHLGELCSMYWATNEDGSFTHTVKAIGERFSQPSHKISKIVADACFARSISQSCSDCDRGFIYKSRSDWASSLRFPPTRCKSCIDAEKRRQQEQRERANSAMKAAIASRYKVKEGEAAPRAVDLELKSALALAALFEDAEEISNGISVPTVDRADRLTPTPDYDFKLLELLADQGLIRIHPSSPLDAFVWGRMVSQLAPIILRLFHIIFLVRVRPVVA